MITNYKAIGHCRVSKGDEEEIKNSLNSQRREITRLAERLDIAEHEIKWYIEEEARSAFSERSDWSMFESAIKEACSTPSIKYFLDFSQERFCRNRTKSQNYKRMLSNANVKLCFVSGNIDNPDSMDGFIMDSTSEIFAELYSRKIGIDTLRGCKENAVTRDKETGYAYKNGGSAPFWLKAKKVVIGTDRHGEDIKKVIWVENDNVHTTVLNGKTVSKTMWDWAKYYFIELRLKQKLGIEKARDILNELAIPAPRKGVWATTCLYEAEKNEALIGIGTYNKRKFSKGCNGKLKDPSEWIIVENAHPALLTKDEFEGLQLLRKNKLKRKGSVSKFQSNNEHLLVGYPEKFTCSCCGNKIISSGNVYTCGKYNTYGKKGCGASYYSVNCEWLEDKILQEIMKLFSDSVIEKTYEEFKKLYQSDNDVKKELKNLDKNIKDEEVKQNNLIQAITNIGGSNVLALNQLTKTLEEVSNKIEELKSLKSKIDIQKSEKVPSLNTFKKLISQAKLLLTRSNTAENKTFIWYFVESIKLDPIEREVIVSFYKNPFSLILEDNKNDETKKEGAFAPSMKLVAGAGFEPTTFGL